MNLRHGAPSTLRYIVVVYPKYLGLHQVFVDMEWRKNVAIPMQILMWPFLMAYLHGVFTALESWALLLPMGGFLSVKHPISFLRILYHEICRRLMLFSTHQAAVNCTLDCGTKRLKAS